MATAKGAGRAVGILLLVQMPTAYVWNFVLLQPLSGAPGGLLVNAASDPARIGIWALVGLVLGGLAFGIALAAYPVVSRHSARLELGIVVLGGASVVLYAVQDVGILGLLSLSEARTATSAGSYEAVAVLARALKNWTHFSELVVSGAFFASLFTALLRFRLVPRVLALIALAAVALQLSSVTRPFFGREVAFPLLAPMGLCLLLLALWLVVRGFAEPPARS